MNLLLSFTSLFLVLPLTASAHSNAHNLTKSAAPISILSDIELMKEVGITILNQDEALGVGYAQITPQQAEQLSTAAHKHGRCGGFEALSNSNLFAATAPNHLFSQLRLRQIKNNQMMRFAGIERREQIDRAIAQVREENLRTWVQWFSAFPTRLASGSTANDHVNALKTKIEEMISASGASFPVKVDLINHTRTPQKSIRVSITGSQRPSEIIVLGGHMDSINQEMLTFNKNAPGADDNASGSANLLEALRIMLADAQPQRTVEFIWYAGEELGLLGSAEIATSYKQRNANVVGVLQLDMTLFPGDGEFTLGSMTDFTSAWLRGVLMELNSLYIKANVIESRCGYACSDHASWNRQGYPTIMPFEATMNKSNPRIHTKNDIIDGSSNFRHSAMFTKIALALAIELGNSTIHE